MNCCTASPLCPSHLSLSWASIASIAFITASLQTAHSDTYRSVYGSQQSITHPSMNYELCRMHFVTQLFTQSTKTCLIQKKKLQVAESDWVRQSQRDACFESTTVPDPLSQKAFVTKSNEESGKRNRKWRTTPRLLFIDAWLVLRHVQGGGRKGVKVEDKQWEYEYEYIRPRFLHTHIQRLRH